MSGRKSRDKGYRGEREAVKFLQGGFKRTGYAGTDNPDVSSEWAIISVKNKEIPPSLKACITELIKLEAQEPEKEQFVMIKVNHRWIIVERAEQFREARC